MNPKLISKQRHIILFLPLIRYCKHNSHAAILTFIFLRPLLTFKQITTGIKIFYNTEFYIVFQ